ncbi:MAG: peptidoglycan DD-metalloendopeptidase family protein [Gelidibacter sp.]|nr:peptidoglycan DD-metalloendopeptidase family protein [Gelidibacter sp.]
MKRLILLIAVLVSTYSFSQEEKDNYASVAKSFETFFNEGQYESIFNLFDNEMKAALPLDKTKEFLGSNLRQNLGKIQSMTFLKTKETAHIYKTAFENGLFDILLSLNEANQINGLYVSQHVPDNLPTLERNITKMILPFKEEWFVFWGGETVEQNYHVAHKNQKYAYDILMMKDGKSYIGDSKKNENYLVFGKDIIAPCDATVIKVIDGVNDNVPGELNPKQLTGNTIILKTENEEFILFAHLKHNSIIVKEGENVKKGQLMAKCGNSGNTTEPHLHLSLQNVEDMNIAEGAKLYFDKIMVNGKVVEDYIPVKGDKIKNLE